MKYISGIFFVLCIFPASATSLLTANEFPKTFNDLSFTEKLEVKREGYAAFESEYDENGRCITNCAYYGIKIEDEVEMYRRNTEIARLRAERYLSDHPEVAAVINAAAAQEKQQREQAAQKTQPMPTTVANMYDFATPSADNTVRCDPSSSKLNPAQEIPLGSPLDPARSINSKFGSRFHPVDKVYKFHKGIDMPAPKNTDIYAPAAGTIERVWTDNICGKGIKIKHAQNFETVYCHLNEHLVTQGQTVRAGCRIGLVGTTGKSTGNHLHYEVHLNDNPIDPTDFVNR